MWITYAVPLAVLAVVFVVLPSLLLARSGRAASKASSPAGGRPSCRHQVSSYATGIACPCVTGAEPVALPAAFAAVELPGAAPAEEAGEEPRSLGLERQERQLVGV